MIHTATLVHDDVLDNARIRRHRATVNAGWGNESSVLLGDFLFTHAFHLASSVDASVESPGLALSFNRSYDNSLLGHYQEGAFGRGWHSPWEDVLVSEPARVGVELLESGPLRARLRVTRVYEWPEALADGDRDRRSGRTVPTPVDMLVEVRAGEPFVRVSTSFLNRSADHRLRLHVPLPLPVTTSASAGQFAVTERGLTAEGGWGEYPLPTFPASTFVAAGPATVLLDHSTEYELVDDGSALAVTLLRAIGSSSPCNRYGAFPLS